MRLGKKSSRHWHVASAAVAAARTTSTFIIENTNAHTNCCYYCIIENYGLLKHAECESAPVLMNECVWDGRQALTQPVATTSASNCCFLHSLRDDSSGRWIKIFIHSDNVEVYFRWFFFQVPEESTDCSIARWMNNRFMSFCMIRQSEAEFCAIAIIDGKGSISMLW